MYTYIYDAALTDKKYSNALNKIEGKLTDLGLSGRICRLSPLRNLRDVVSDELRRMPETIVVVGGDSLLIQVIALLKGSLIPLAIIPLGESTKLASSFGITEDTAAQVLSARRIISIDGGSADGRFFLKKAQVIGNDLKIIVDNNYSVRPNKQDSVEVFNFLNDDEVCCLPDRPHPQSGKLYLVISRRDSGFLGKSRLVDQTVIACKHLDVSGETVRGVLDDSLELRQLSVFNCIPSAFNLIVGKQRNF